MLAVNLGGVPLILISLIFLIIGVWSFRRVRQIERLGITPCKDVQPGLVQVAGKAVGKERFPSFVLQVPSYCSLVRISPKRSRSSTHKERLVPFKVQDETGSVLVDPEGAEFDLKTDVVITVHNGRVFSCEGPGDREALFEKHKLFCRNHAGGRWYDATVEEKNLCPNGPVLVLGTATESPATAEGRAAMVIRKSGGAVLYVAEASREGAVASLRKSGSIALAVGLPILACGLWLMFF